VALLHPWEAKKVNYVRIENDWPSSKRVPSELVIVVVLLDFAPAATTIQERIFSKLGSSLALFISGLNMERTENLRNLSVSSFPEGGNREEKRESSRPWHLVLHRTTGRVSQQVIDYTEILPVIV
jgi:hypothetical protein